MKICEYGCGQEAKYRFSNGKYCCSKIFSSCLGIRKKFSEKSYGRKHTEESKKKMSESHKGQVVWNIGLTKEIDDRMKRNSNSVKKAWADPNSMFKTKEFKLKRSLANKGQNNPMYGKKYLNKLTIEKINKKYPLFSKVEEMRYNPDKSIEEKEIQVHCKNHDCSKSKEKGGWFTPTRIQFNERIRQVENGNGGSYFYCSEECKNICPLYNLHKDPFKNIESLYTQSEHQTFRNFVLERDNYICQFCGEKAEHVHHERPQKLEPFFALDPDYAWSCCKKCHYERGHQIGTECDISNLSKRKCN